MINGHLLLGGGVDIGDNVAKSARFRASASPSLSRVTTSGSTTTATASFWVKRGILGDVRLIRADIGGVALGVIYFDANDKLNWFIRDNTPTTQVSMISTQVFRDVGAWYHIVAAMDSTQATASNRCKMYVNGVQITAFDTATYPGLSQALTLFGNGNTLYIGKNGSGVTPYFDGYLADVIIVDGQQLTPSSFGRTSPDTGAWVHANYSGTYGTNGSRLQFNSVSVASDYGTDTSGNSNTFTVTNLSVTTGVTYDWMSDTPTNNYPTLNPLNTTNAISNGNLTTGAGTTSAFDSFGTFGVSSGKWYWETTQNNVVSTGYNGIAALLYNAGRTIVSGDLYVTYGSDGNKYVNGAAGAAYGATYTTNDVIGVALDCDGNTVTFYKNNVSQGSIGITSGYIYGLFFRQANSGIHANFGQRPFTYTPPTGFSALCTANLSTPTIIKGNTNFDVDTYTGVAGTTQTRTPFSFKPDFVWIKRRSNVAFHVLTDSVRGVGKSIYSNDTGAEATNDAFGYLQSFDSTGYTVNNGSGGIGERVKENGGTFVGWAWKATGTTTSNTSGSITSTVSANTAAGFSIVTYTGNSTNGATVGHGLGVTPSMVIIKNRTDAATNWGIYHSGLTSVNYYMQFDTSAQTNYGSSFISPSSTLLTLAGPSSLINTTAKNYVAYCFSEVAGFSKFGGYTGNASTDGPFIWCGFRPRWLIIKCVGTSGYSWIMEDSARDTYNVASNRLLANTSDAEASGTHLVDFLSNGFKLRGTDSNTNGATTYIFAAFAELPFKYANAR